MDKEKEEQITKDLNSLICSKLHLKNVLEKNKENQTLKELLITAHENISEIQQFLKRTDHV